MTGSGSNMTLPGSINYVAKAQFAAQGSNGIVQVNPSNSSEVSVLNADEALILVAIDTNYIRYDDISGDPAVKVSSTLSAVENKKFDELMTTHVTDYTSLFNRVSISLGMQLFSTHALTFLTSNYRYSLRKHVPKYKST